jgi:addiction module HigA family antidote
VHPGEILREEWMRPLSLTAAALARALKLPRPRINDLVLERRAVTADTALRLARYFGTSPGLWLRLQAQYDLVVAERASGRRIAMEVEPRAA